MWVSVCVCVCDPVVWEKQINPKPNLSAQNTKCTILWSRIWRWQGKQTSGKWIKLHSRIAEFWRILMFKIKTVTPVQHTICSCVFVYVSVESAKTPITNPPRKKIALICCQCTLEMHTNCMTQFYQIQLQWLIRSLSICIYLFKNIDVIHTIGARNKKSLSMSKFDNWRQQTAATIKPIWL